MQWARVWVQLQFTKAKGTRDLFSVWWEGYNIFDVAMHGVSLAKIKLMNRPIGTKFNFHIVSIV